MTIPEIVARPADAVQRLFVKAGCPLSGDGDFGVTEHFQDAIKNCGLEQIPFLQSTNAERLPHHSLVRFYGMVQDLLNPEYYVGAFKQGEQLVTTKYCDPDVNQQLEDSHEQPVLWERRPVVCVPVPGLSSWTLPATCAESATASAHVAATLAACTTQQDNAMEGNEQSAQPSRAKRERERSSEVDANSSPGARAPAPSLPQQPEEEEEDRLDTDMPVDQGATAGLQSAVAAAGGQEASDASGISRPRVRRREERSADAAPANAGQASGAAPAVPAHQCQTCGQGPGCGHDHGAQGADAGEVPGSCIVYLYDTAPCLVLHEVVEVVGILSHVPQLVSLEYGQGGEDPVLSQELAALGLREGGGAPAAAGAEAAGAAGSAAGAARAVGDAEDFTLQALRAAHPPTSKVMRLHGIIVRRAPNLVPKPAAPATPAAHAAPATTEETPAASTTAAAPATATTPPPTPASAGSVASLRARALSLLRLALGGDALAAEYVLLQLLARVTHRGGDPGSLAHMVLNLSRCPTAAGVPEGAAASGAASPVLCAEQLGGAPSAFASALHAAVSSLVPLSAVLPLTVEACNRVAWCPLRDVTRERTVPSPLQLAPGTVLLLDETAMAPGQLSERGVASMQALVTLAQRQELLYDFEAYKHPIPVDLPLIVLAQGRSLLRDCISLRVPHNPTRPQPTPAEVLAAAAAQPAAQEQQQGQGSSQGDTLAAVRAYLGAARGEEEYSLGEGVAGQLEQYFVENRRRGAGAGAGAGPGAAQAGGAAGAQQGAGEGGITAEDFHLRLALARLLVLSHGETTLTPQRWQELLQLEHAREARLRVM